MAGKDPNNVVVDLTLPERIPNNQLTQTEEHVKPIALYTLCTLSDEQLESYRQECTSDPSCDDDMVRLPPQPHFPGRPLQSVVDYHLELAREEVYQQFNFIVCVYPDATTALLVTLTENSSYGWDVVDDGRPGLMWVPIQMSGIILVCLNVGVSFWGEQLEGSNNIEEPRWDQLELPPPAEDLGPEHGPDGRRLSQS